MKPFVTVCLIGLASALLLVGALSGTLVRHLVQILPILLVCMAARPGERTRLFRSSSSGPAS